MARYRFLIPRAASRRSSASPAQASATTRPWRGVGPWGRRKMLSLRTNGKGNRLTFRFPWVFSQHDKGSDTLSFPSSHELCLSMGPECEVWQWNKRDLRCDFKKTLASSRPAWVYSSDYSAYSAPRNCTVPWLPPFESLRHETYSKTNTTCYAKGRVVRGEGRGVLQGCSNPRSNRSGCDCQDGCCAGLVAKKRGRFRI